MLVVVVVVVDDDDDDVDNDELYLQNGWTKE